MEGPGWSRSPPPLDMSRVVSMVIIGVTIRNDLRITSSVDGALTSCSGFPYNRRSEFSEHMGYNRKRFEELLGLHL